MKVKICGVTHPEDATYAAECGANYIGIIFSDKSKRQVTPSQAKLIVQAARQAGAEPVGVFVDETAELIEKICDCTGIEVVQLHGAVSRKAFCDLPTHLTVIYAVAAAQPQNAPANAILLYDSMTGGSGMPFDWSLFSPPQREWYLAGGLNPANVAKAITLLQPDGVDVSSGVEFSHLLRKDPVLVQTFIEAAKKRRNHL